MSKFILVIEVVDGLPSGEVLLNVDTIARVYKDGERCMLFLDNGENHLARMVVEHNFGDLVARLQQL